MFTLYSFKYSKVMYIFITKLISSMKDLLSF